MTTVEPGTHVRAHFRWNPSGRFRDWLISDVPEPPNEALGITPLSGLPLLIVWGVILLLDAGLLALFVWGLRTFRG